MSCISCSVVNLIVVANWLGIDKVVEATHDGFLACFEHRGTQISLDQWAIS